MENMQIRFAKPAELMGIMRDAEAWTHGPRQERRHREAAQVRHELRRRSRHTERAVNLSRRDEEAFS